MGRRNKGKHFLDHNRLVRQVIQRILDYLQQRSPTFLAPGTGFVEDNFSPGRWGGAGGDRDGSGGNASDGEQW